MKTCEQVHVHQHVLVQLHTYMYSVSEIGCEILKWMFYIFFFLKKFYSLFNVHLAGFGFRLYMYTHVYVCCDAKTENKIGFSLYF